MVVRGDLSCYNCDYKFTLEFAADERLLDFACGYPIASVSREVKRVVRRLFGLFEATRTEHVNERITCPNCGGNCKVTGRTPILAGGPS